MLFSFWLLTAHFLVLSILSSIYAGDFGTFVVHGGDEEKASSFNARAEGSSQSVTVDLSTGLRYYFYEQLDSSLGSYKILKESIFVVNMRFKEKGFLEQLFVPLKPSTNLLLHGN